MELREFAERILFATTLEEKLQAPGRLTDDHPGRARSAPDAPGRPAGLKFRAQAAGPAKFPGVRQLEQEQERGRLLHFFANHELLATELMALVLLRFPEAPAAFRRGIVRTLQEEQLHTRLYLERMQQCRVRFGELPVSGYFWRSIANLASPLDYVVRLSLTFEQANLDYAHQFAESFARLGDDATAALLDRIYRDEIGHVAYGLKWFRKWKEPGLSDWEAFCRHLAFPLSPSRAKGPVWNPAGRRAAGLDEDFIHQLNLHAQSRGRTPGVFWFNPLAEGHIAHGRSFTPVKQQAALARDLANLPQFLCRRDDLVLIDRRPTPAFLSGLKAAGFILPEFVELQGLAHGSPASLVPLAERKLGRLRPWAWGPDSLELFRSLMPSVTGEPRAAGDYFHAGIAQLYSKAWSAAFLRRVLAGREREEWLCPAREVGVAVTRLADALAAVAAIRSRGHHRIVVKEAIGLAGHNAIRLWEPELLPAQRRWMTRVLESGQTLIVEPWLERVFDFSIQLEMQPDGLEVYGYTGLINDRRGQFEANWAEPHYRRRLPPAAVRLLEASARPAPPGGVARRRGMQPELAEFFAGVCSSLEGELRRAGYLGPVGLDAFVYRDADGICRLKPVVEINPRYTMGRLTLELMRQTCPGSYGLFRLLNRGALRAEGAADWPALAHGLQERFPLRLAGEPVPRIEEGAVCLSDPAQAQVCLAVFRVSRSESELVPRYPSG